MKTAEIKYCDDQAKLKWVALQFDLLDCASNIKGDGYAFCAIYISGPDGGNDGLFETAKDKDGVVSYRLYSVPSDTPAQVTAWIWQKIMTARTKNQGLSQLRAELLEENRN